MVIECRRILRWTYVHAYYIESGAERTLFEYRQGELEKMTETLNKLTEGDIEQLSAARINVLNMTQALSAYMEGMENDRVSKMVKRPAAAADEDEKEAGGRGKARGGKKAGKAKKKAAEVEEQWTTDAQGVIVRGKVEKGKKASAASRKANKQLDAQPAAAEGEGAATVEEEEENDDAVEGQKDEGEEDDEDEEDEAEEQVDDDEVREIPDAGKKKMDFLSWDMFAGN